MHSRLGYRVLPWVSRRLHVRHMSLASAHPAREKTSVVIEFDDKRTAEFSALWLRDNCLKFATASHREYAVAGTHGSFTAASIRKDGHLLVDWADSHFSIFPPEYLRRYLPSSVVEANATLKPSIAHASNPIPEVSYDDLGDDRTLYAALKHVNDIGAVIIKGAPPTKETAEDLMAKFCDVPAYIPLYGYGSDFLLGAEKNETQKACPQCFCNIPMPIEFHQDFAYFEDVPGLFFNLCMRIDKGIVGGTNTVMDAFFAAEELRRTDPEAFETLASVEVTFAKTALNSSRPVKTSVDRTIIQLGGSGEIVDVMWSLMYLRTQRLDAPTLDRFVRAREAWKAIIARLEHDGHAVETPMQPGDCTIVNNKRMMHARLPFVDVDGVRQFYQCYGSEGLFRNRFKVLQSNFEDVYHIHKGGSALSVSVA